MASTFAIKKNDTLPLITVTLKDGADVAIDVSDADVTFRMRKADGTPHIYKASGACDFVTDGTNGQVAYSWSAGDLDTPGDYLGEFVIDFGGGDLQTCPNDDYVRIKVVDLA